jgi:imidazole glycerol-phosphate synthase subunit HisH
MIAVIDYGMSNLASLANALAYIGVAHWVTTDPKEIQKANKLILPGVGAFGEAMKRLNESGFSDAIKEETLIKQKPILGICLGMQLLYNQSEEHGHFEGLGLVTGRVRFLGKKIQNPVPHVGWNSVLSKSETRLLRKNTTPDYCFYFVHSFYCDAENKEHVSGIVEYGGFSFDAVIESKNISGCQFHPEKSQKNGIELLRKFAQ